MTLFTTDHTLLTLELTTVPLVPIKLPLMPAALLHKVNNSDYVIIEINEENNSIFFNKFLFIKILATIKNALRQEESKLFAAFGNVLANDADQALWLAPICSNAGCEPSAQCDAVQNTFVSGLHYRVFFQNTGFIQAPQKKVIEEIM
jgi:hypothetical protein